LPSRPPHPNFSRRFRAAHHLHHAVLRPVAEAAVDPPAPLPSRPPNTSRIVAPTPSGFPEVRSSSRTRKRVCQDISGYSLVSARSGSPPHPRDRLHRSRTRRAPLFADARMPDFWPGTASSFRRPSRATQAAPASCRPPGWGRRSSSQPKRRHLKKIWLKENVLFHHRQNPHVTANAARFAASYGSPPLQSDRRG